MAKKFDPTAIIEGAAMAFVGLLTCVCHTDEFWVQWSSVSREVRFLVVRPWPPRSDPSAWWVRVIRISVPVSGIF